MSQKDSKSAEPANSFSFLMPLQSNTHSGFMNFGGEIQNANKAPCETNSVGNFAMANISSISSSTTAVPLEAREIIPANNMQQQEIPQSNNNNSSNNLNSFQNNFEGMTAENMSLIFKNRVDEMNKKREKDSTVTTEFHSCVIEWANESTSKIIDAMFKKFQENSLVMSSKLELIQKDLETIAKLEDELLLISNQVEQLYKEIKQNF
jgi:hypothetical protein